MYLMNDATAETIRTALRAAGRKEAVNGIHGSYRLKASGGEFTVTFSSENGSRRDIIVRVLCRAVEEVRAVGLDAERYELTVTIRPAMRVAA